MAHVNPALKRTLQVVLGIIIAFILVFGAYIVYLLATYNRIPDNQTLEVKDPQTATLQTKTSYTVSTYNIGFGAYTPDYTFFMDEGVMDDGTATVGNESRAKSEQSVLDCTNGAISTIEALDPDFCLFQEVDTDSDRSYHVNQRQMIDDAFTDRSSIFAVNFHSAYLAYPLLKPHGTVNSGLLSLSDATVTSALRRSYPLDESFPTKFFDLDRCFEVMRIPVSDGHDLVLINNHMSAYDEGGLIRAQQLALLDEVLQDEYAAGNYVIAGGDWNHALCGSVDLYPSQTQVPSWVAVLDDSNLPTGFHVVCADNLVDVASCRADDIPYEEGVTYRVTVDGFIISDNVTATARNIDTGFAYSDHNPVLLTFQLG